MKKLFFLFVGLLFVTSAVSQDVGYIVDDDIFSSIDYDVGSVAPVAIFNYDTEEILYLKNGFYVSLETMTSASDQYYPVLIKNVASCENSYGLDNNNNRFYDIEKPSWQVRYVNTAIPENYSKKVIAGTSGGLSF